MNLLHTYRGPLPKRLVGQASQATNIPCLWNKSFLPCLSKPAKIDFEAMGISTSEIKGLRNYNYQRENDFCYGFRPELRPLRVTDGPNAEL